MGFYFDFESAEGFATGAIGAPGERTFYLQVRADGRTVSMKCEKQQVAELSRYLRGLLDDLPDQGAEADESSASLMGPVEQDFVLGSIGLGVDRSNARMVVQLEEMVPIDDEDDVTDEDLLDIDILDDDGDGHPTAVVRVLLTAAQARAFCDVADSVVTAGRPLCVLCGQPRDPVRHACPRMN